MKKTNNTFELYRQTLNFIRPFWKPFLSVFALITLIHGGEALGSWLVSEIFNKIQSSGAVAGKKFFLATLIFLLGYYAIDILRSILDVWKSRIEIKKIDLLISHYLNHESLSRFFSFSGGQHQNEHSGVRQTIVTKGVSSLKNQATQLVYDFIPGSIRAITALAILMYANVYIGLAFLGVGVVFVILMFYHNRILLPGIRKLRDHNLANSRLVSEMFRFITLVKNEAQETRSLMEVDGIQKTGQEIFEHAWIPAMNRFLFIRTITFTLRHGSLILSVWMFSQGQITMGGLFLIITWGRELMNSLWLFSRLQRQFLLDKINIEKYIDVVSVKSDVELAKNPIHLTPEGSIEFKGVSFGYPQRTKNYDDELKEPIESVLKGISFKINPGEKIGIVGESGSGKSTLASLILRSFDPQEGQILIDGNDLRLVDLNQYLKHVGVVPQEVELLDRTIRENILFGLNGKAQAFTEEMLQGVAKLSGINGFFARLEHGYDTLVGERGLKLSGGERQRIGIARALVKEPKILIFDEATSALDTVNERLVQEAINKASVGKTALIIAHRLSTVRNCDKIMVFRAGYLVDMGIHEELMDRCEYYAELISHQLEIV